ncbi:MAG: rod shape-determining protein MreC [Bacteroidales bacterium]|nr:rod shape-determining protein MreC [Bacteroidales bacterium]
MQNLFAFIWKYSFYFLFLLLMVISFVMMVQNNYYQKTVAINSTNGITGNILSVVDNFSDYLTLRYANQKLAEENARLLAGSKDAYLYLGTEKINSNDSGYLRQYDYVAAKVISNSVNRRNNYMKLNKGRLQGIKPNMAVIAPDGVVGQVIEVSTHFSSVMSVLNRNSRVSAKLKSSNQVGSLQWDGENYRMGKLIDIPSHVQIIVGDSVVTSGFSHVFPEGRLIGVVENFRLDPGENFYQVKVRFTVDFNKLSYVYVVKNVLIDELMILQKSETQN